MATTPTICSPVYSSPVSISTTTTLKFFAKDTAGNSGNVVSQPYTINISTSTSTTTSSSSCQNSPIVAVTAIGSDGNVPQNAIDGNLATRWSNLAVGSWIKLDLGTQQTVCSVDIAWYHGDKRSSNFIISTSIDGTTFTNVYSGTSSGTTASFESYNFADTPARYVMITVNGNTANNWASISEINVKTLGGTTATTSTIATTSSYNQVIFNDHPIMFLAMDTASTGTQLDLSDNGHHGVYTGATPT